MAKYGIFKWTLFWLLAAAFLLFRFKVYPYIRMRSQWYNSLKKSGKNRFGHPKKRKHLIFQ
ncbi:MAG: hypothetical protein AAFX53_17890 [Bacteroidota bacterium]